MIPKTIHCCWFGRGEKPKLAQKCIESWKKYCPDYEIIEWNEDTFNVNLNDYTRFTYEHELYAYLSDYVRLWAVENKGGVYFDTDVELIKPIDSLLQYDAFWGFEDNKYITSGVGFGSIANHQILRLIMEEYEKLSYEELSERYKNNSMKGSPRMNTYPLLRYGLLQNGERQSVLGAEIFPKEYFCPLDDYTGKLHLTENTLSIHWYTKSANSKYARIKSKYSRLYHRIIQTVQKNGKA